MPHSDSVPNQMLYFRVMYHTSLEILIKSANLRHLKAASTNNFLMKCWSPKILGTLQWQMVTKQFFFEYMKY